MIIMGDHFTISKHLFSPLSEMLHLINCKSYVVVLEGQSVQHTDGSGWAYFKI
jgi:hypothetical protein